MEAGLCVSEAAPRWIRWHLPRREFFQENPIGYPRPEAPGGDWDCEQSARDAVSDLGDTRATAPDRAPLSVI